MAHLGSFTESVDLPEFLRPWAYAGVEAFFLPEEPLRAEAFAFLDGPSRRSAQPESAPTHVIAPPHDRVVARPAQASAASAAPQTFDLPEPWAGLAARVIAPPRVIITYAALCDDMIGRGDPVRRKVFRDVLRYLAWPRGTSLFWPIFPAAGDADAATRASDLFVQGVTRFNVAHIVAFGADVARRCGDLYPQEDRNPPVVVHALPAPESLSGLLPHEFQGLLVALKRLQFV